MKKGRKVGAKAQRYANKGAGISNAITQGANTYGQAYIPEKNLQQLNRINSNIQSKNNKFQKVKFHG